MEEISEMEQLYQQYHPAFCAALMQTFEKDLDQLICQKEHNLNTMPNRIDFLMIKKDKDTELHSGLGKRLKQHTLYEYKSPRQEMGIAEYHLGMAYVHLYVNYEGVEIEDITLSFVREGKPVALLKYLKEQGFAIEKSEPGIYHVEKPGHVDMQILITRELSWKYTWLKALTDKLTGRDVELIAQEADKVKDERGRQRVRSVLDLISLLNRDKKWMKEMMGMGAFLDLFKEEFEEKDRKIKSLSEQLQNKDEQLQNKDEQLQNKDEQLQNQSEQLQNQTRKLQQEEEENSKLRKELEELKKQIKNFNNKIATF